MSNLGVEKMEVDDNFDLDNFDFNNIDFDDSGSDYNYPSTLNQLNRTDSTFSDKVIGQCEKCGEEYTNIERQWCKPCQINYFKKNFTNWTSGNEKIDNFIQELQLGINDYNDIVFEWVPYNQLNDIKEIGKSNVTTDYSAIWKDGPLEYDIRTKKYERYPNRVFTLKCFYDTYNIINEFLNKVKAYSNYESNNILDVYGISQNPDTEDYIIILQNEYCERCVEEYTHLIHKWCKLCKIKFFKRNFTIQISGNEKIDNFIQKLQLRINGYDDIVFEWIPYNQFDDIKEIGKSDIATVYLAIWKDGTLEYDEDTNKYKRNSNKKVALKCFYNSQNITDEFLNEVQAVENDNILYIYGISQHPDTKDYIMVLQDIYCETCGEQYIYSNYDMWCKQCVMNHFKENFTNWTSRNEKIDNFIQGMQLEFNDPDDIVFEWIPYNQFEDVKEISKDDFTTIYSAIWKDGPLNYNEDKKGLIRKSDKKVALKCLFNSQNNTNEILEEVKVYLIDGSSDFSLFKIYGISQNPDTNDYIMVLHNGYCEKCGKQYIDHLHAKYEWCEQCQINYLKINFANWTSGNETIDNFIQGIQLRIDDYNDVIFEWISYNQFNDIKEIDRDGFTTLYSAIWKDGPLVYDFNKKKYERITYKKVALKWLFNSQSITDELLDEIMECFSNNFLGISQNPVTKDYLLIVQDQYCENCGKKYTETVFKWCKLCHLKENFTNWTSGSKKLDEFIQKLQLRINDYDDIVFEWIPYNQFDNIKKIGNGGFATVYSTIWKDGPLEFDKYTNKHKRNSNKKVALKCLYNSQNITDKFLNEIEAYSNVGSEFDNIIKIYGISQNPDTKDHIMVLQYAEGGTLKDCINIIYKILNWETEINILSDIICGLDKIHQKRMVHHDFHAGNILFDALGSIDIYISDMGLCGKVDNIDEKNIYGVMPYVAPEVLSGKPYTQAADIYSFGMIMYFVTSIKQPFANCAHDENLALNICNGVRPEINELEVPKCYIDLMKRCWDPNPNNRPNATEVSELIELFQHSYTMNAFNFKQVRLIEKGQQHYEIENQFKKVEEYRKVNLSYIENRKSSIHVQAIYTSRLLNSFTKDLPKYVKYDNTFNEFSDEIAMEQLLVEHVEQLD